jgi:DNA modification methylase
MACLHDLFIVRASPTVCQPTETNPKRSPVLRERKDCRRGAVPLHCADMNRLLFGDNLKWLRDRNIFPDAHPDTMSGQAVDLVYLDPPFNSNATYNVLFKEASGEASQAQFHAFTDTWEWTADVDATYAEFVDNCPNASVVELVEALKKFLKTSPMMAYLAMMAPCLVELRRVLKPTGLILLSGFSPWLCASEHRIHRVKDALPCVA